VIVPDLGHQVKERRLKKGDKDGENYTGLKTGHQEEETEGGEPAGSRRYEARSDGGEEGAVEGDVAVGHAGSVEGEAGVAGLIEEDEAAGAVAALLEEFGGVESGAHGERFFILGGQRGAAKEIHGGFGHDDFHDGFAMAGAGSGASGPIGVAAATDERRIADATGKFAAGAAGGSGGEEAAFTIKSDGADGALLMAAVMSRGVGILAAAEESVPFGFGDKLFGLAHGDVVSLGEMFGAFGDEHHVRTTFENGAGGANGIAHAAKRGGGSGAKTAAVHDDGVAFDVAIAIEMGAVAGVEDGIVLEDDDGRFDGIEGGAAGGENGPARDQGEVAALLAGFDGFIGNVPGTAVNNESRFHGEENGKRGEVCPEEARLRGAMEELTEQRDPPRRNRSEGRRSSPPSAPRDERRRRRGLGEGTHGRIR